MTPQRKLDPLRSLWDVIALEVRRQLYWQSMSASDVARLLECDRSTVSRVINGHRRLKPDHARALDEAWKLEGHLSYLVAHASARPDDNWLPSLAQYETAATRHRTWDISVVPGLWQTPDYARATFEQARAAGLITDVDKALETRLERQAAVWERPDPPRVSAILSWAVLAFPAGGPKTMRSQLSHLLELGERPGASVRIVGRNQGWTPGNDGAFKLLTVGGDVAFVEATGMVGNLILEPERVERYARRFEQMNDLAWSVDESRDTIEKAMGDYA